MDEGLDPAEIRRAERRRTLSELRQMMELHVLEARKSIFTTKDHMVMRTRSGVAKAFEVVEQEIKKMIDKECS